MTTRLGRRMWQAVRDADAQRRAEFARQGRASIEADARHPIHLARRVYAHHQQRVAVDPRSRAIAHDLARTIDSFGVPREAPTNRGTINSDDKDGHNG